MLWQVVDIMRVCEDFAHVKKYKKNTIQTLKKIIQKVSDFFYHLVADVLTPKSKEKDMKEILGSLYTPKKHREKSKDNDFCL